MIVVPFYDLLQADTAVARDRMVDALQALTNGNAALALAINQPKALVAEACDALGRPSLTALAKCWIERAQSCPNSLFFPATAGRKSDSTDKRRPAVLIVDELDRYARQINGRTMPFSILAIVYVVEAARMALSCHQEDSLRGFADLINDSAFTDAEHALLLATPHAICDIVARMAGSLTCAGLRQPTTSIWAKRGR